jgi:hypothetical protein
MFDGKQIGSGTIGVDKLSATGTPDATTILHGDNTWKTAPIGGGSYWANTTGTGEWNVFLGPSEPTNGGPSPGDFVFNVLLTDNSSSITTDNVMKRNFVIGRVNTLYGPWNSTMNDNVLQISNSNWTTGVYCNINNNLASGSNIDVFIDNPEVPPWTGADSVSFNSIIGSENIDIACVGTANNIEHLGIIGCENINITGHGVINNGAIIGVRFTTPTTLNPITDTVMLPKLILGRGTSGALPTTGETNTLGYNASTGEVVNAPLVVQTAHIQLTQAQIQAIFTTPIELIPAPGAGKFIQVIGASGYLNHNGTTFAAATDLLIVNTDVEWTLYGIIDAANDVRRVAGPDDQSTILDIDPNQNVIVGATADATGAGGTIDVWVQYAIIDTN